ncbi:MAG: SDR family oxidoreductase, partial [Planctomycetota bacterium]
TGCSSGFGFFTAQTLARNGFHVFASMRNVSTKNARAADDLRQLARAESLKLEVVEIDIDSDESVDDGIASVMKSTDKIDVLFNNAGINIPGPVELSMDAARRSFETNFFGQLRMLRAVAPGMRENRHGLIIQMSSGLGRLVQPTSGMYSATKFAQEALFESAAYELHPFGIEVAIIQPSDYDTRIKANSRRYFQELIEGLGASDQKRARDYAEHMEITRATLEETPAPPPQEVADIVLELANTPAGQRPLRRVAMPPEIAAGLNQLNGTLEEVQAGLLQSSGMGNWLELTK